MKSVLLVSLFLFFFLLEAACLMAQKQLVLDRYKPKRIRLYEGDNLIFKQRDNKYLYKEVIGRLRDSTIVLGVSNIELPISEIQTFYFHNNVAQGLRISGTAVGLGFLFSAAVQPLITDAFYDRRESAILGLSFLAGSQLLRLMKWKKFRVNRNSRVRIMDTTIRISN